MGIDLDNFILPGENTAERLKELGMRSQGLGKGVEFFGHDEGIAFKFDHVTERNAVKSKLTGAGIYDTFEVIQWFNDRFNEPTERVHFLPAELLEFEDIEELVDVFNKKTGLNEQKYVTRKGDAIGGKYLEDYRAWKKGIDAPGLSLKRWGELSDSEIATFHEMRIYSVEQLGALPPSKFDRLPVEFQEAHEKAVEYAAGKENRDMTNKLADQILEGKLLSDKQAAEIEELRRTLSKVIGTKKSRSNDEDGIQLSVSGKARKPATSKSKAGKKAAAGSKSKTPKVIDGVIQD